MTRYAKSTYQKAKRAQSFLPIAFTIGLIIFFLMDSLGGEVTAIIYFLAALVILLLLRFLMGVSQRYFQSQIKLQENVTELKEQLQELKNTIFLLNENLSRINPD